jgi:hypothetical protein
MFTLPAIIAHPFIILILTILGIPLVLQERHRLVNYLRTPRIAGLFLFLLTIFTTGNIYTAMEWGIYCGVVEEEISPNRHYYLHRWSIFMPYCGSVGVLNFGPPPPGFLSLKSLTPLGTPNEEPIRLISHLTIASSALLALFPSALVTLILIRLFTQRSKQKLVTSN